jgi:hypothetical protein
MGKRHTNVYHQGKPTDILLLTLSPSCLSISPPLLLCTRYGSRSFGTKNQVRSEHSKHQTKEWFRGSLELWKTPLTHRICIAAFSFSAYFSGRREDEKGVGIVSPFNSGLVYFKNILRTRCYFLGRLYVIILLNWQKISFTLCFSLRLSSFQHCCLYNLFYLFYFSVFNFSLTMISFVTNYKRSRLIIKISLYSQLTFKFHIIIIRYLLN